ncbi:meiosis-specific nuclear structural protein 1-like [Sabethes cyaneus]|uniref:meiosis-specific nuclear structural protein 1-like n=1 Tax=Sabethes cyaneus TaxID=53552 RepID=UPI00237DB826|nr:meiosis-specific nuclear structural protein 1-like [Sabethes cyaneus]
MSSESTNYELEIVKKKKDSIHQTPSPPDSTPPDPASAGRPSTVHVPYTSSDLEPPDLTLELAIKRGLRSPAPNCPQWFDQGLGLIVVVLPTREITNGAQLKDKTNQKSKEKVPQLGVRTFLLSRAPEALRHEREIQSISKQIAQTFAKHFPSSTASGDESLNEPDQIATDISKAIEGVRNEIEILNDTASGNDRIVETDDFSEGACGGVKEKSIESKKQEIESSVARSKEILEELSQYEQGNKEIPTDLIKHLKTFVAQTTEKERQYREKEIQREERMLKEAKKSRERKIRLEKLLQNLNERMKNSAPEPKLEFPLPLKLEDDTEKNNRKEKVVQLNNVKPEEIIDLPGDNSEKSDTSLRNEYEPKRIAKKIGKKECAKFKKFREKHKSSSDTSDEMSSFESSEQDYSSEITTSDSSGARQGIIKKHRKYKKNRESLKRVPISEWKLRYDGKDNGRRLIEFLKEIQTTNRLQTRNEKFADYFSDMNKLFQSMTRPISDRRKFKTIWRNMRFDYKNAMIKKRAARTLTTVTEAEVEQEALIKRAVVAEEALAEEVEHEALIRRAVIGEEALVATILEQAVLRAPRAEKRDRESPGDKVSSKTRKDELNGDHEEQNENRAEEQGETSGWRIVTKQKEENNEGRPEAERVREQGRENPETQSGELLFELKRDPEVKSATFKALVETALGSEAQVKALSQETIIEAINLDEVTTESEAKAVLTRAEYLGDVPMSIRLRKAYGSTQTASIRLSISAANRLLKMD